MRFVVVVTLALLAACRAAEAESAYEAEQLDCVHQATSRAEADACRERVRAQWDAGEGGAR